MRCVGPGGGALRATIGARRLHLRHPPARRIRDVRGQLDPASFAGRSVSNLEDCVQARGATPFILRRSRSAEARVTGSRVASIADGRSPSSLWNDVEEALADRGSGLKTQLMQAGAIESIFASLTERPLPHRPWAHFGGPGSYLLWRRAVNSSIGLIPRLPFRRHQ
jgi:hypothetical protein